MIHVAGLQLSLIITVNKGPHLNYRVLVNRNFILSQKHPLPPHAFLLYQWHA